MSNDFAKFKNSKRRHKTDVFIARQLSIAKQSITHDTRLDKEPHRLAKRHAMDCGKPGCTLCGNPRRNEWFKKERRTTQERRQMQDIDAQQNGVKDGDSDQ